MKRLALLLCFALVGFAAAAQMMPDSTVQFVARWNPGDKQVYDVSRTEYKVSGKDTTDVEKFTQIMGIEVLSKKEDTYQLCITYQDVYYSDPQMNALYKIMTDTSGDMKVLITTDKFGAVQTVDNVQELIDYQLKVVDPFMEMMDNEPGEKMEPEMRASLREYLVKSLSDVNLITQSINDRIGKMLYFHGSRLDMNQKYEVKYQTSSIMPGVDTPMTANGEIWIDKQYTDSYSAVGHIYSVITQEDLSHMVVEYIRALLTMSGMTQEEAQTEIDNSKETIEQLQLNSEESVTLEVHMDTGWPLNLYYDKYVYTTVEGVTTTKEDKMAVNIILQNQQ